MIQSNADRSFASFDHSATVLASAEGPNRPYIVSITAELVRRLGIALVDSLAQLAALGQRLGGIQLPREVERVVDLGLRLPLWHGLGLARRATQPRA